MRNQKSGGFTLIELLVVIAIIGVLATISVAAVNLARNRAKIAKAQNDIDEIYKAISSMANDTNAWPKHQTINLVCSGGGCGDNEICGPDASGGDCDTGLSDSSSGIIATDPIFTGWSGPYMHQVPLDPWDHEYFFDTDYLVKNADNTPCNGDPLCYNVVVVGSYGPDGLAVPTGTYGEDDIIKIIK